MFSPLPLSDDKKATIEGLLFSGRKIEAIKVYREATALGLKEAKDGVDALEQELRRTSPEKFVARPQAKGCFGTAAVLCVALVAVGYWVALQLRR